LGALLRDQARIGNFNYRLVQDDHIAWDKIDDRIKINWYRIAQEALHNIIKHAKCSSVEVALTLAEKQVSLVIRDDGVGFDPGKKSKGIGLRNMESRAKSIGARLIVNSEREKGTTITISIPTKTIYNHAEI
jgi:signal transduction histidine kinase